jgi:D-glycero-alpha-D-manno-heptose-7-phosphate kinase
MIITRTPYRISLYGGATDLPDFFENNRDGGAVLNFAINKYIYIYVQNLLSKEIILKYSKNEKVKNVNLIEHKLIKESLKYFKIKSSIEIHSMGELPGHGTGLGSSSAFTVGLLKALSKLKKKKLKKNKIIQIAIKIEKKCYPKIGYQDHFPVCYGNLNLIKFKKKKITRKNIYNSKVNKLIKKIYIVNTLINRSANKIIKKYKFKKDNYLFLKNSVKETIKLSKEFYKNESFLIFLLKKNWDFKKSLGNAIVNKKIKQIYEKGLKSGAVAGKLLGAGGGGFLLFYVQNKKNFLKKMKKYKPINIKIDKNGSTFVNVPFVF